MSTTRKDYIAIAAAIANADAPDVYVSIQERALLAQVAEDIADHFERDNPRFDRDRFLDAALPWTRDKDTPS